MLQSQRCTSTCTQGEVHRLHSNYGLCAAASSEAFVLLTGEHICEVHCASTAHMYRLLKLDVEVLHELHYQMITLGKVCKLACLVR